jgi:hypothetical protein
MPSTEIRTAEDVERILRSVILQYGLFNLAVRGVSPAPDGWKIAVFRQGGERNEFVVPLGTPARIREHIARQLGAPL